MSRVIVFRNTLLAVKYEMQIMFDTRTKKYYYSAFHDIKVRPHRYEIMPEEEVIKLIRSRMEKTVHHRAQKVYLNSLYIDLFKGGN